MRLSTAIAVLACLLAMPASATYTSNPVEWTTAVSAGLIAGYSTVNKFGRTTNADSSVATDVWDMANATDDQPIWVAPTAARLHNIASTSASDDGSPVGVGARTIRVYGLTDWDTAETSEVVTLNGQTDVATANSYVIIHRMKVLTKGATATNVGVISATAQTDATVTAQINAGEGQTQMAIYGVPSTQTAIMLMYYASALKKKSSTMLVSLLVNPEPDAELTNFLVKHTNGIVTEGSNYVPHEFEPPFSISGPAIIKLQVNSDIADMDASAGFDIILKTN